MRSLSQSEMSFIHIIAILNIYKNLQGILKVVKRGGQIVFNLMERGTPYAEEADGVVNQLTSTGEMQIIEVQEFDSITNGSNHPTLLYIGKRL